MTERISRLAPVLLFCALAACSEADPFDVPGPDWDAPVDPSAAPAVPMPRLEVRGNALVTVEGGRPVRLRGLNVCGLEFDEAGAVWELGEGGSGLLATLSDPARWSANAVRVPVNQQWFLEDEPYVRTVERLIDDANDRGVYVLLDLHWEQGRTLDPYTRNILEVPTFGLGNTTESFWHKAVSRFANRTNLLYELVNEPHDWPADRTARAMQALADRVRRRQGDAVVVIDGMDWAHSVDYYREHPLAGANLVYAAHLYPPHDPPASFGQDFVDAARSLPVLIGEFSAEESLVDGVLYQQWVVEVAEASGAVGWLPWAVGCGIDQDGDTRREPLAYLSRRMRELNP